MDEVSMDITDIKGVGPARKESMVEAGYDSVESIAEADDHEEFAEAIDVPADTALEFMVQAENMVEEEAASVESSEPGTISEQIEEAAEDDEEPEDDESEEVEVSEEDEPDIVEDDGPEEIDFDIEFQTALEYDVFYDAVLEEKMKIIRANRTGVEEYEHVLDQMRHGSPDEAVSFSLTGDQLNNLHQTVRQKSIDYQGKNLIDHMDAMKRILVRIDEVREEYLF